MTDIPAKARTTYVDGVPPSKADIHQLFDDVAGEIVAVGAVTPVLLLHENSWGYDDPVAPASWLSNELRACLAANYGARWILRNTSEGGKSIGVPADPERSTIQLPLNLNIGGVTVVVGRNPINDISQGRSAVEILGDIATCRAAALLAGAIYLQPNCPPFNNTGGVNFYSPTTRAVADAVNAGLSTVVGAGHVLDLWTAFNDASNDGTMLLQFQNRPDGPAIDRFHLNKAGKAIYAGMIVSNAAFVAAFAAPPVASTPQLMAKALDPGAIWQSKGIVAGHVGGAVGVINVYHPISTLDDQIAYFAAQPNNRGAGWGWGATINGALTFWSVVGVQTVRFLISSVANAFSVFTTKLHVQADGVNTRFSGSWFGSGSGAAIDVMINNGEDVGLTGYSNGGAGLANFYITAGSCAVKIGGAVRLSVNADGTISLPGLPYFSSNAAAVAAMGAGKLFFNTTANCVDYSR